MQGLYAIVNVPNEFGHSAAELTHAVLADRVIGGCGASVVQLRAKSASTSERVTMLETMAKMCKQANTMLLVNDDVEAALLGPACGVHLGQADPGAQDVPAVRERAQARGHTRFVVGLSTHNRAQLQHACIQKPDYIALGPIAPTQSKPDAEPVVGLAGLLEGCRLSTRPLVAIGGLDQQLGAHAVELGAAAVAVIGALQHPDLETVATNARTLASTFLRSTTPLPFEEVAAAVPIFAPEQLIEIAKWSDDLSLHMGMGLPARFSPRFVNGNALYRRCDLLDLLFVLDKRPEESWDTWSARTETEDVGSLIQLRRNPPRG